MFRGPVSTFTLGFSMRRAIVLPIKARCANPRMPCVGFVPASVDNNDCDMTTFDGAAMVTLGRGQRPVLSGIYQAGCPNNGAITSFSAIGPNLRGIFASVKKLDDITTTKPTTTTTTTMPDLTGIDPLIGDADPFACSPGAPFIEDQSEGAREWSRTRVSDWSRIIDGQQVVDRSHWPWMSSSGLRKHDTSSSQHRVVPSRVRTRVDGARAKYVFVGHGTELVRIFFGNSDTTRHEVVSDTSSCPVVSRVRHEYEHDLI